MCRHWPESAWLAAVRELAENRLRHHPHGDLPRWKAAVDGLPPAGRSLFLDRPAPVLGLRAEDPLALADSLMVLHPWRKGPLYLGGVYVDAEWRSDWKWERIRPHLELEGRRVLDIGCGNGYFGLRMLGAGARLVIGIDPTLLFVMQWQACRHFSGDIPNYVLPIGIEDLPEILVDYDTVFSMGVLYHRREPLHHLRQIRELLGPEGVMVLETLVLPRQNEHELLIPESRYARMRNIWSIPGSARLLTWVEEAGFSEFELVDLTPTTVREQRSTAWMRFESLEQALDPMDRRQTVEGLPAPVRAIVIARR